MKAFKRYGYLLFCGNVASSESSSFVTTNFAVCHLRKCCFSKINKNFSNY